MKVLKNNNVDKFSDHSLILRHYANDLDSQFPGMKDQLWLDGDLYPGIAVIIDGETANLGVLERVREDSEIHFLPAISGG